MASHSPAVLVCAQSSHTVIENWFPQASGGLGRMCVDTGGLGFSHRAGPGELKLVEEDNSAFEASSLSLRHSKMSRVYFHAGGTGVTRLLRDQTGFVFACVKTDWEERSCKMAVSASAVLKLPGNFCLMYLGSHENTRCSHSYLLQSLDPESPS